MALDWDAYVDKVAAEVEYFSPGYDDCLEAAGADVLDFERFGSYQGEWWALVRCAGALGFVSGGFGSCSGCDAIEALLTYCDNEAAWAKAHREDLADIVGGTISAEDLLSLAELEAKCATPEEYVDESAAVVVFARRAWAAATEGSD